MHIVKIAGVTILIFLGGAMFVFGGLDDSPGAQLLGVVMALIGGGVIYKMIQKKSVT